MAIDLKKDITKMTPAELRHEVHTWRRAAMYQEESRSGRAVLSIVVIFAIFSIGFVAGIMV